MILPRRFFAALFAALFAAVFSALAAFGENGADIFPLAKSGALFKKPLNELREFGNERYTWVEQDLKMRLPTPGFTFAALTPGETLLTLDKGKITSCVISLFNRGDDGAISAVEFEQKLGGVVASLSKTFGAKPRSANHKTDPTSISYDIGGYSWNVGDAAILLQYSVSAKGSKVTLSPDYIKLTVESARSKASAPPKFFSQTPKRQNIRKNIRRDIDGATEIGNVPMVDQGQKGYCAAATTARVMAYYGFEELDQHQIAMWASSEATSGTDVSVMFKAIRRILHDRYKLRVRYLEELETEKILALISDYNKRAEKTGARRYELPKTHVINVNEMFASFDPQTLLAVRCAGKQAMRNWLNNIKQNIDIGVPILWSVELGLFPETPPTPQAGGGHMRLIIGYNLRTNQIIYTDSWGDGHERKFIDAEVARAITKDLMTITPVQ